MLQNLLKKKTLKLDIFITFLISLFLCAPIGCTAPPKITVVLPEAGITQAEQTNIALSFAEGSSPINLSSFQAYNNTNNITSLFDSDTTGAEATVSINEGVNLFSFSLNGTDGAQGDSFTTLYKPPADYPPVSGDISIMSPSAFNTEINQSGNASNALTNYASSWGINPNNFYEAVQIEITNQNSGHTLEGYWAEMSKSAVQQSGALMGQSSYAALLPNEEAEFVQIILPLSYTGGGIVRDYTLLIIRNLVDKYVIFDTGEGEGNYVRIDYEDINNTDSWTFQYFINGVPVDPPEDFFNVKGAKISGECAWSIFKLVVASSLALGAVIGTNGAGLAIIGWFGANIISAGDRAFACGCNMGTYPRCN